MRLIPAGYRAQALTGLGAWDASIERVKASHVKYKFVKFQLTVHFPDGLIRSLLRPSDGDHE